MDSPKEEDAPVFLNRSSRLTRGKRMTKLLDDEVEEDEVFWNQDALKEDAVDDEYEEEPEAADEFDSDFNEDESEPEGEAENEAVERSQTKKRLIFPGKISSKNKNKKRAVSKIEKPSKDETSTDHSTPPEHHDTPDDTEVERTVRKSTRTSVIVRQAERDAIRAALQATMKPIKRKNPGEEKKMTQEDMLLEAAQTEIMNLRNLERVLAREEEVKKKAIVHKAVYNGPRIQYLSINGCSYLEFSKGSSFQAELSTTSVPCIVTQKQGCLMQLKKLLRQSVNVLRMMVREPRKWIWDIYLLHFLAKDSRQGGRDQLRKIEMKCPTCATLLVFAKFQHLILNFLISFSSLSSRDRRRCRILISEVE